MIKIGSFYICLLIVLVIIGPLYAHVQLDYPSGGETFTSGQKINIRWHTLIEHDQINWDLYYSTDGGNSWDVIELNIDISQTNYSWNLPEIDTETARIQIIQDNNGSDYDDESSNFTIHTATTVRDEQHLTPDSYTLFDNYPNPFNPTTAIGYQLSAVSNVNLSIYNVLGQKVATLVSGRQRAGIYQVQWDASGFPSGVYFYQLRAGDFVDIKKMVLLR